MALFYQSGRVNRFSVGVPGFSTETDLVLNVDGAIGVSTLKPRGAIDTPEISIRGDIIDSSNERGANAYFLSQDVNGVRWRAGNPSSLAVINVQDDGSQVGFGSFDTLNFIGKNDEFVVEIEQDPSNSSLANIVIDARFTKTKFGNNFGLSTNFGPDGTFWSIPGYGTSDGPVGFNSVGLGTIQPQDDFQVGIGSTGVQINGALGRVEAQIIKAKNLELDGNLTAESLVIDPGISTFRGNIDAQGISSFSGEVTAGIATIENLRAVEFFGENVVTGFTSIGVGLGSDDYSFIESNLEVSGGIATFINDVYVGNDLYVAGETFFNQINAENIIVTGIATINEFESLVGQSTYFTAGVATVGQIGFNTGVGTALSLEKAIIGIATIGDALIGVSTIGFASITDAFVGGAVTVTRVDVEEIEIDRAGVGVLTVGLGFSETDPTFYRTGVGTIVGFTTVTGDFFVDGDLTVTQQFTVKDLGAENLEVTGIGTIVNLKSNVGIITTLFTEGSVNTGVSTFQSILTEEISAVSGDIGGVDFEGGGEIAGTDLEFETGRIGILTGNLLNYSVGVITALSSGVGTISTITGTNLSYSDFSTINGVSFGNTEVTVNQTLKVIDPNGFGIQLGDITDTTTGLTTVAGDLYVGNDLFVQGELNFRQLNGENLFLSGIATVNNLDLNSGIATQFEIDYLQAGLGTITNLLSTASTITELDARTIAVSTDPNKYPTIPGQLFADSTFFEFAVATDAQIQEKITVGFNGSELGVVEVNGVFNVSGLSTFSDNVDVNADLDVSGLTSTRDLYVSGIATINELDVEQIEADAINTGIATVRDLTVTGVTTFQGEVTIQDIIFINQEVTGVSTVTNQVVTGIATINDARIGFASVGIATIATADIADATIDFADIVDAEVGVASLTYAEVGSGSTTDRALNVTGVSTFTGFTTFSGDVFVDGDFTVTGVTSFSQLDAAQSQIGILTVFTRGDFNGITDIENAVISDGFQSNAGVSTLGFTTITDSLHIDNNLYVGGITTFDGIVNIEETSFVFQEVTGISTVNQLFFNVGIGTTLTVKVSTADTLTVNNDTTLNELTVLEDSEFRGDNNTFLGSVGVGSTVTTKDLVVTNNANIANLEAGVAGISTATIGFASITNELVGVSTVGFLSVTNGSITGIVTFTGELDINADVDIDGLLRVNDLVVTGVSTLNVADISDADIDTTRITDASISTARIGFSSVGILTVGFGSTLTGSFYRTGVGTIVGFTTITGDLFVDGDLTVTGVVSFSQLDARQSRIGILTVTDFLDANYIVSGPVGFATLNDLSANSGIFTSLTATNATVTGVLTATELDVTDLTVQRNLKVNGISTLGAPGPLGITTTLGDLYVGGDLFVQDDIFYDEISGRNLFITGIGTINDLRAGIGSITTLQGDQLTYNTGIVTNLTSVDANLQNIVSSAATIANLTVTSSAYITGVTTVTEDVDLEKDVSIGNNLNINNEVTVGGLIQGADIFLSGAIAGVGASFTNGAIDNIQSIDIVTNTLTVGAAATFNELEAARIEVSTLVADDITTLNIANSGLTTTSDLTVYNSTNLEDLFVNGTTNFNGEVNINADLIINGNIDANSGIVTVFDLEVGRNLNVSGITTTASLNVNGGEFFANGISTFQSGLDVENTLNAFDIVANSGIITTLNSEDLTSDTVNVNERLIVSGTTTLTGIVTANDLDVDGTANIQVLNAGFGTITDADIGTGFVENLSFSSGVGTDLTVENAGITTATITQANVTNANVTELNVGIVTVTTRLDYDDVVSTEAIRLDTFATTQVVLLSIPAPLRSAEFTITAEDASDVHSTKIHLVRKGTNLFFNEYSVVTSGPDLGVYDVVDNGGSTDLLVTPTNSTLTRFTVYSVAHK